MRILYRSVLVLLLPSCASAPIGLEDPLTPAQLNASWEEYQGRRVRVQGWMRADFENYGLWQSEEANAEGDFASNCVSLMVPESLEAGRFNKRYVLVEGIFLQRLPSNIVHLGGCNVTTLQLLEDSPPISTAAPEDG